MGKFFRLRDGNIFYNDIGAGKTIVLLHGYLETSAVWDSFAGKLAKEFRVIIPDIPGHGKSDIFDEVHSMEFIAMVIKELLIDLGIKKICLTGHSLGGYATLAFAEMYPDLLSGYCLFHSHPLADAPEALEKREREINLVLAGKKDLIYPDNVSKMFATANLDKFSSALQRSKQIASSVSGEGIIAVLKGMMARPSRLSVMEKGQVPCLWILGRMDNYINCDVIQTKVKLPPNAEVVILENSGHLGFIEEEDLSVKILGSFVKRR
ncbi:MAG: alpha/beta fold hydrolase [Bacteroidales bacterium]